MFTPVSMSVSVLKLMLTFACQHSPNYQLMTNHRVASMHVFKATTLLVGDSTLYWAAQVTVKYVVVPCQSFFCLLSWCKKPLRLKNFLTSFLLVVHLLKKEGSIFGAELHFCLHSRSFLTSLLIHPQCFLYCWSFLSLQNHCTFTFLACFIVFEVRVYFWKFFFWRHFLCHKFYFSIFPSLRWKIFISNLF